LSRRRVARQGSKMNLALWVLATLGLGSCELVGRIFGRGWPTATQLLNGVQRYRGGGFVLAVAWLWLGWHVFAR
jgi:hypothetical protein